MRTLSARVTRANTVYKFNSFLLSYFILVVLPTGGSRKLVVIGLGVALTVVEYLYFIFHINFPLRLISSTPPVSLPLINISILHTHVQANRVFLI